MGKPNSHEGRMYPEEGEKKPFRALHGSDAKADALRRIII